MFTWLSDVFASNSDKARLIAIVISAIIAIAVLLLNQYFATRRARKELLIKKIEDVYQSSLAYENYARQLLKVIGKGQRDDYGNFYLDPSLIDSMNEEVEKMEMIVGLYFQKVKFDKNRYYAGPTLPVLEIAIKEKRISEDEAIGASEKTQDNINRNVNEIKVLCVSLMNKYRH